MSEITTEERFWAKVQKTGGCWTWTGATTGKGYGHFRDPQEGRGIPAHRYVYRLTHGSIPDGMFVDHVCHNRLCVNPGHLRLATNKQNQEHRSGAQTNNQSTGIRGVSWDPINLRYTARVRHNGKQVLFKRFRTLAEAEAAVIAKRAEVFTHNDVDRALTP